MAAQSSTRLEVPERTPPKQEEPARGDRNDEKPFATYAKPKREQCVIGGPPRLEVSLTNNLEGEDSINTKTAFHKPSTCPKRRCPPSS
jgi:hypothetical protein